MNKIIINKRKLAYSDYKIIKCMEAMLNNEPMPYNVKELLNERNNCRKAINNEELKLMEKMRHGKNKTTKR